MITERQKKFYKKREKEIGQPDFIKLKNKLLSLGGEAVVPMYEEDLNKILRRGKVYDNKKIDIKRGYRNECHMNVGFLHEVTGCKITTGWALSDDGLWRQHTWCTNNELYETTEKRKKYYGFTLNKEETEEFISEQGLGRVHNPYDQRPM